MHNIFRKCAKAFVHLGSRWRTLSPKKKIIASLSSLAAVVAVAGGVMWYNDGANQAKRDNIQQDRLIKHSKMGNHPKWKHYKYHLAGGVPSLSQLKKQRAENPHPYLRGQISIPRLGVDVPVFEGTSLSTLAYGAGTAKPYEQMGKGNFAVEAHNFSKLWDEDQICPNWFFSNLEKHVAPYGDVEMDNINVHPGDVIYSLDKKNVYKWIVIKDFIRTTANPYDGDVLTDSMVKKYSSDGHSPLISLGTCYEQWGILFPAHRIVVMGQLVKTTPRSQFKPMHQVFKDV